MKLKRNFVPRKNRPREGQMKEESDGRTNEIQTKVEIVRLTNKISNTQIDEIYNYSV